MWQSCSNFTPNVLYSMENETCEFSMLSCRFLNQLDDTIAHKVMSPGTPQNQLLLITFEIIVLGLL